MSYEELVERVKNAALKIRVSKTIGHAAFQFNIEGDAEGAFYLEISEGKINVEPYEYFDRDVIIVTTADVLIQLLEGKLQARAAYSNGLIKAYGDINQLNILPLGCECKATAKNVTKPTSK